MAHVKKLSHASIANSSKSFRMKPNMSAFTDTQRGQNCDGTEEDTISRLADDLNRDSTIGNQDQLSNHKDS